MNKKELYLICIYGNMNTEESEHYKNCLSYSISNLQKEKCIGLTMCTSDRTIKLWDLASCTYIVIIINYMETKSIPIRDI